MQLSVVGRDGKLDEVKLQKYADHLKDLFIVESSYGTYEVKRS